MVADGLAVIAIDLLYQLRHSRGIRLVVQERLSAALPAALRDERLRLAEIATTPVAEERATPESHRRFLAEDVARWRPIIQTAGEYGD